MPVGLVGYLLSLVAGTGVIALLYHLLLPLLLPADFAGWGYGLHAFIGVLTLLEGAIFALFLSLLTALPMLVLVFPAWLLGITPWVWPVALLTFDIPAFWLFFAVALLVHLIWPLLLVRAEVKATCEGRR